MRAVALLPLFLSSISVAADQPNPWTDCGIGAMIFGGIDGDAGKIMAAISNITWDLGSTGTSSATMSPSTCKGADATAAVYIQKNLKVVQEEIAVGDGEHLAAVWSIYGCADSARTSLTLQARTGAAATFNDPRYYSLSVPEQAERLWMSISGAVDAAPTGTCEA